MRKQAHGAVTSLRSCGEWKPELWWGPRLSNPGPIYGVTLYLPWRVLQSHRILTLWERIWKRERRFFHLHPIYLLTPTSTSPHPPLSRPLPKSPSVTLCTPFSPPATKGVPSSEKTEVETLTALMGDEGSRGMTQPVMGEGTGQELE